MGNKLPLTKIKIAIARILYKIVRIGIRKNPVYVKRAGINYELDLTEGIDLSIFLFGGFQKHVYKNLNIDMSAHFTIVDVGGNIGSMSLTFAKLFPEANVIAFEPTHYACERFKRNLQLNSGLASRIELVQSFLSDRDEENPDIKAYASWNVGGKPALGERHEVHLGTAMDTTGVGANSLDWFVRSKELKNIRLIKIDTDGFEFKVLKGSSETISIHQPLIVFEIGKYVMKEHNVPNFFYLEFFESLAYELFNSQNLKKITMENWSRVIPELGTIDILARPKK